MGILTPASLAASRIVVPFSTVTGILSILTFIISLIFVTTLFLYDSVELAGFHTYAALDTFGFINSELLFDFAAYCAYGAFSRAKRATAAGICYFVTEQRLANARGAFFVDDVGDVFVAEITQSGKNGVRSRLSETAEAVCLYVVAKFFHLVEVLESGFTVGDFFEVFQQTTVTDTARRAFSAAFVNREFQEELLFFLGNERMFLHLLHHQN